MCPSLREKQPRAAGRLGGVHRAYRVMQRGHAPACRAATALSFKQCNPHLARISSPQDRCMHLLRMMGETKTTVCGVARCRLKKSALCGQQPHSEGEGGRQNENLASTFTAMVRVALVGASCGCARERESMWRRSCEIIPSQAASL